MDEVLTPGWREQLEIAHSEGIERPQYRFITSWDEKGKALTELDGFRIHKRHGMTWVHPIHEVLRCTEGEDKHKVYPFEVHHLPDHDKPRNYLKQLEAAVKAEPNSRNLYYLAREYFGHGKLDKAQKVIKRYLKVSEFDAEKSYALRMLAKCEVHKQEHWLLASMETYPSRESVLALANYYYTNQRWQECNYVAKRGLDFKERSTEFLSENWAWGHMGYDLAAVSAWKLGKYQEAYEYGQQAVLKSPNDETLQNNLKSYREKIDANV
jgi:tetratricopeptide (TPR) repeat protein